MKRNKTDLCSALMLTTLFVIAGTGMAAAQNIQFQELYSFLGYRPSYPQAPPVEGADGNYYGTTSGGGIAGVGTVFKISTNGEWAILHSFTGPDGSGPTAPLTHSTDGNFYGTTYDGGSSNLGTVFRIT